MELNFDWFYNWVYKSIGVDLNAYKDKQLRRRIALIMNQSKADSLENYAALMTKDENVKKQFIDFITIHVTDFFRNPELFREFENQMVHYLTPAFGKLKVWSAACSIGSEAYSLAMIVAKNRLPLETDILATDLDRTVLNRAKLGIYTESEVKNISLVERETYLHNQDGKYRVKDFIREKVKFKQQDLILDSYEQGFHAIVCRNVTIYFKTETKEKVYQKFSDSLVKGGLFFTGSTETIYGPEDFGLKRRAPFIYEKM